MAIVRGVDDTCWIKVRSSETSIEPLSDTFKIVGFLKIDSLKTSTDTVLVTVDLATGLIGYKLQTDILQNGSYQGQLFYWNNDSLKAYLTDSTDIQFMNHIYTGQNFSQLNFNNTLLMLKAPSTNPAFIPLTIVDSALTQNLLTLSNNGDLFINGISIIKDLPLKNTDTILVSLRDTVGYKLEADLQPDTAEYSYISGQLGSVGNCGNVYTDSIFGCSQIYINDTIYVDKSITSNGDLYCYGEIRAGDSIYGYTAQISGDGNFIGNVQINGKTNIDDSLNVGNQFIYDTDNKVCTLQTTATNSPAILQVKYGYDGLLSQIVNGVKPYLAWDFTEDGGSSYSGLTIKWYEDSLIVPNNSFSLGGLNNKIKNINTYSLLSGSTTISGATITNSTGTISFDNENLTTTGTVTGNSVVGGSTTISGANITNSTGTISFDNENLTTTGIATITTINSPSLAASQAIFTDGSRTFASKATTTLEAAMPSLAVGTDIGGSINLVEIYTDTIYWKGGGKEIETTVSMINGATFTLASTTTGRMWITVGDNVEWAEGIHWTTGGTVVLGTNSANVVNTDTGSKFCIITGANPVIIKNNLGSTYTVTIHRNLR